MWSWGTANQGQCGTAGGSAKPLLSPTPASTSELQAKVVAVAAGEAHCLAQDELGNCYVWGRTREGQAGRVGPTAQMTPMLVKPLQHETVTRVACGSHTCYAVTASGQCYVWGSVLVETGESLHNDAAGYGRSFAQLSEGAQRMVRQSVSDYITCTDSRRSFLNEDGTDAPTASASGEGAADDGPEALPEFRRVAQPEPLPLPLPPGVRVRRVASGFSFCVMLLEGGGAMASGFNDRFQLGLGDRQMRGVPAPIRELRGVELVEVACGQQHTVALGRDGRAYSWGLGSFGQLGHGSHADEPRPRKIDALEAMGRCIAVACGHLHTALLLMPQPSESGGGGTAAQTAAEAGAAEGASERPYVVRSRGGEIAASATSTASGSANLYGFGHAEFGQLGTGDMGSAGEAKRDFSLPRLVPLPRGVAPRAVACGALHTCVLARSGQVLTFGWGSAGALGHGTTGYVLQPTVIGALRGHRIRAVAAGSRHVTALEDEPDSVGLARDLAGLLAATLPSPASSAASSASASSLSAASATAAAAAAMPSWAAPDCCILIPQGTAAPAVFPLHRTLLAARCPTLLAMLLMQERFCASAFTAAAAAAAADSTGESDGDSGDGGDDDDADAIDPRALETAADAELAVTVLAAGTSDTSSSSSSPSSSLSLPLRLHGVRVPVFRHLVSWLYTGRLHVQDAMHTEALAACARRLRLPRLAALCDGRLREQRGELDAPTVAVAPWGTPIPRAQDGAERGEEGEDGEGACGMDAAAAQHAGEDEDEDEDEEGGASGTLGGDLSRLLESGQCADVTLRAADGATVRASRLLLCCRSEYFRTCLSGDSAFAEATAQQRDPHTGDVMLDLSAYGLAAADLRALLQFLYAGRLRGAAVAAAAAAAVAAAAEEEEVLVEAPPTAPEKAKDEAEEVAEVAKETKEADEADEAKGQPEHQVEEEGLLDSELLGTLRVVPPQLALTLLRAATALLLDDLKVLCEAVLVRYLDADNCAALAEVAESCFAPRLHGKCVALLERVRGGGP